MLYTAYKQVPSYNDFHSGVLQRGVVGVMVSIAAFQAADMGSIPVPLNFFVHSNAYVHRNETMTLTAPKIPFFFFSIQIIQSPTIYQLNVVLPRELQSH